MDGFSLVRMANFGIQMELDSTFRPILQFFENVLLADKLTDIFYKNMFITYFFFFLGGGASIC